MAGYGMGAGKYLPHCNLHAPIHIDESMQWGDTIQFSVTPDQFSGNGPFYLRIPSTSARWLDLSTIYIMGTAKVRKIVGGVEKDCDGNDDYSMVNFLPNTMWKSIQCRIGNTNFEDDSTSSYHYKAYMDMLFGHDATSKRSLLQQTSGYYKDLPISCKDNASKNIKNSRGEALVVNGKMDDINNAEGQAIALDGVVNETSGYSLRRELIKNSKDFHFVTKTCVDFFENSEQHFAPGHPPIILKFIKNDDKFVIISNSGVEYVLKLTELKLEVRAISMHEKITKGVLDAQIGGRPFEMPFLQTRCFYHPIHKDSRSFIQYQTCTGRLPKKLIVGFVDHAAFENMDIDSFSFKLNNASVPATEYRPEFDQDEIGGGKFLLEYQHFLDRMGVKRRNIDYDISPKDWSTNNCV